MECVAHNGVGGGGVHAVARCCVTGGLRCQVHASPEAGRDAECEQPQHHLTGESQPVLVRMTLESRSQCRDPPPPLSQVHTTWIMQV